MIGTPCPTGVERPGFFGRILGAIGIYEDGWTKELGKRKAAVEEAALSYQTAAADWTISKHREAIESRAGEIGRQCDHLASLRKDADSVVANVTSREQVAALRSFLEYFPILSASIEGVGQARVAALEGAGIDTAADVTAQALAAVPGFGVVLTARVIAWRKGCESRFRIPKTNVSPAAGMPGMATVIAKSKSFETAIRDSLTHLDHMILDENLRSVGVKANLDQLARNLAQARADMAVMA